uniref:DUF4806 domain-containing protein n=1 Tax=Cyprinus carpio carpio TaxID=630221 RepID=A0A8C0XX15_CYPCA
MFYIVEFIETQEVEVVPALWVKDEICQWPAQYRPDDLGKAIRSEEQPGHMWDTYHVRILYTAATYKAARLKLPQAETHTDLQTAEEEDADENPKKKRKRLCKESSWNLCMSLFFLALLHRLLTNQEMMMDQLKVILKTMQKMGEPARGQEPLERDILPLKDPTSLLGLEKNITALSVIGGVDIKDSVWRVMKHCFTNSLAKQLNWRGINGKTAFHRLQLKDVITGTVRNSRLTATATDQEIEFYIKKWLHLACDRDGGRREREKRRSLNLLTLMQCELI